MKIAFLDGLDESYNEAAYEKMLYYGKLLHDAMGRGWFKYRVDGGYTRPVMDRLSREVELWVCHTEDFSIDDVDYFRKKGAETWFYRPMIYEQKKNGPPPCRAEANRNSRRLIMALSLLESGHRRASYDSCQKDAAKWIGEVFSDLARPRPD
jgi:hypothetical protein